MQTTVTICLPFYDSFYRSKRERYIYNKKDGNNIIGQFFFPHVLADYKRMVSLRHLELYPFAHDVAIRWVAATFIIS